MPAPNLSVPILSPENVMQTLDDILSNKNVRQLMEMLGEAPTPLAPAAKGTLGAGMVMNPKNALKLKGLIKSALEAKAFAKLFSSSPMGKNTQWHHAVEAAADPEVTKPIDIAMQFVQQAYPTISKLPEQIKAEPHPTGLQYLMTDLRGYQQPGSPELYWRSGPIPEVAKGVRRVNAPIPQQQMWRGTSKKVVLTDRPREPEQYVDTLAHELVHSRQAQKDPIGLETTYIPSTTDFDKYHAQSWEVNARRGGETAVKKFDKFQELLAGPVMPPETPIDKDFVNEVLVPIFSELKVRADKTPKLLPSISDAENATYKQSILKTAANNLDRAAQAISGSRWYKPDIGKHIYTGGETDRKLREELLRRYAIKRGFPGGVRDAFDNSIVGKPSLFDLIMK